MRAFPSFLFQICFVFGQAFTHRIQRSQRFSLFGSRISQWRNNNPDEVHLLPFPVTEALLPGQSTTVLFKEGRFFDLMDDAIDNHNGIIGQLLIGDDGLITDGLSLCEIKNYQVHSGFRGKVTVDVDFESVGRARLKKLIKMKPTMIGEIQELNDESLLDQDLKKSKEMVEQLKKMLLDIYGDEYLKVYERTHSQAMKTLTMSCSGDEVCDLTAASWAIIACLSSERTSTVASKAISTTNLFERLQLGAKAVLEEKMIIQATQSNSTIRNSKGDGSDTENVAFQ